MSYKFVCVHKLQMFCDFIIMHANTCAAAKIWLRALDQTLLQGKTVGECISVCTNNTNSHVQTKFHKNYFVAPFFNVIAHFSSKLKFYSGPLIWVPTHEHNVLVSRTTNHCKFVYKYTANIVQQTKLRQTLKGYVRNNCNTKPLSNYDFLVGRAIAALNANRLHAQ